MYAVTSTPLDRRTRATLRSAELGFLGVMILTCKHTPFFCGQPCRAGCLGRRYCCTRGLRTSWLIVGIVLSYPLGTSVSAATRRNESVSKLQRRPARVVILPGWEAVPPQSLYGR